MAPVSEVIRGWLGWCPNARLTTTGPVILTAPPATTQTGQSGGGAGGAGRIDRGFSLALGSIQILLRNLRLLCFSLLTGLVMSFHLVTILYFEFISGMNPVPGITMFIHSPGIFIAKGSLMWLGLTFIIALFSTIITYHLLAGLIVCVSSLMSGRALTIREALSRAGIYIRPLAVWAVIGALLGTANYFITSIRTASLPVTLVLTGIMFVFFILTMFVVPAIVINGENTVPAIQKSVSVFRRVWGEIVACFGILALILFAFYVVALIPVLFFGFSAGSTASARFAVILTVLVMIIPIFIGSTVTGIASLGLYAFGMTGEIPPVFAEKTDTKVPA